MNYVDTLTHNYPLHRGPVGAILDLAGWPAPAKYLVPLPDTWNALLQHKDGPFRLVFEHLRVAVVDQALHLGGINSQGHAIDLVVYPDGSAVIDTKQSRAIPHHHLRYVMSWPDVEMRFEFDALGRQTECSEIGKRDRREYSGRNVLPSRVDGILYSVARHGVNEIAQGQDGQVMYHGPDAWITLWELFYRDTGMHYDMVKGVTTTWVTEPLPEDQLDVYSDLEYIYFKQFRRKGREPGHVERFVRSVRHQIFKPMPEKVATIHLVRKDDDGLPL